MSKVLKAFNQAAETYDQYAVVQRCVAHKLADLLSPLVPLPRTILEIGCGTGFLTELVHRQNPQAFYRATDLAPAMVEVCRKKVGSAITYGVIDGERVALDQQADWIISNLTFQWFRTLEVSLKNLWDQTSLLAFTLLVDGTFSEWKQLYAKVGLKDRSQPLIPIDHLDQICQRLQPTKLTVFVEQEKEHFSSSRAFIRYLKQSGASTPASSDELGCSFPAMPQEGMDMTYRVAYCLLQK